MSQLELVVGPNGAGKSTFVEFVLLPILGDIPFVNADVIAKERWPEAPESHSYEAARTASELRNRLISIGRSFVAETVFSHPSKLDLVRSAVSHGYDVNMHVVMVPSDLSVQRVRRRSDAGGHDVPEDKIRERHERLWPLVVQAVARSTTAAFYDNTDAAGPLIVAKFAHGVVVTPPRWPSWAPTVLTEAWPVDN
ncbi:AAA family ATPase [Tsukamurella asaccharolytica]|uniref:AAA family ATPase n=1 Tax=Tsukamurella asaccharolytica TaxID=2592067 RepID=A0A5C5R7G4_9ACTN|nr:AAA family ATPase [Tsukamurella asaccharolytica]TWS18243.1 AAA family ATPase [Tsukamurella asaccharolytica]